MKEYNVKELPVDGVLPTGEIGIEYTNGRWERNGQRLLCPVCRVMLQRQPASENWTKAASLTLGWTIQRTLAFKLALGNATIKGNSHEAKKGILDAQLYRLLHKLARKIHP